MKHCCVDNITVRGYSHVLNDRECQDNSVSWDGGDYCAAVVCDGHGGEKYIRSRLGSLFACERGRVCIEQFMRNPNISEKGLRQLELSVIQAWNEAVAAHIAEFPLEQDERWNELSEEDKKALVKSPVKAYGTTFIAAVYRNNGCFVLKLGDGNVNILYGDGRVGVPQELADEQLQFNLTTSLCSSRADLDFKHCVRTSTDNNRIVGIILSTDGVINCYSNEQAYFDFVKNIESGYLEDTKEKAHTELEECLRLLSKKGSGDDLSIAIIREVKKPKRNRWQWDFQSDSDESEIAEKQSEKTEMEEVRFDDIRFYYSLLTDCEKYIYDCLYNAMVECLPTASVKRRQTENVNLDSLFRAISLDNPQLFYVDFSKLSWAEDSENVCFTISYYYSADDIRVRRERADEIIHKIVQRISGSTEYEKELALHDLLAEQVRYDNDAAQNLKRYLPRSNTILGVLFCKTAVCEGIAKVAKIVLKQLGIKSIVVEGTGFANGNCEPHAWNIAEIGGKLRHIDLTWDINLSYDTVICRKYFNLTDTEMRKDHTWSSEYPKCEEGI